MSYGNAVRQREQMITDYKVMLETETDFTRIEDINKQIQLCQEEIAQLKIGKPLFGQPKPLKQTITKIEPDHEKGGQKVTRIASPLAEEKKLPVKSNKKFLANALQNQVQVKKKRASFNKSKKDDDDIV